VSRARDARPGLGFITRVVLGGSPVTISGGSSLRADVVVTPPTGGKGGDASRSRGSGSVASFDDTFFSAGSRTASDGTRTNTSSFYSTTSLTPTRTGLDSGTLTGLRTASTASAISSGESDTQVVSLSSSGRRTGSASMLENSYGSVTPTSSSTSLSRTHEIRRRSRRSSRTYSSSYPNYIDDSSDKENSGSYTPTPSSRSGTERTGYDGSHPSELSSLIPLQCLRTALSLAPSRPRSYPRPQMPS
jgi:hypothetical protein